MHSDVLAIVVNPPGHRWHAVVVVLRKQPSHCKKQALRGVEPVQPNQDAASQQDAKKSKKSIRV
jgi:hypothetical protein